MFLIKLRNLKANNLAKATYFFIVRTVGRIVSGRSVSKIIIIPSFRIGISKSKNIDHRVKETCAIMSTQIANGIDHISALCHSPISGALNFCFLCILL